MIKRLLSVFFIVSMILFAFSSCDLSALLQEDNNANDNSSSNENESLPLNPPNEEDDSVTPPTEEDDPPVTPPTEENDPPVTPPTEEDDPPVTPPTEEDNPTVTPPTEEDNPTVTPPTEEDDPTVTPPSEEDDPPVTPPSEGDDPPVTPPSEGDDPPVTPPSEGDDPTVTPPSEGDDPPVTPPSEEDDPPVTPPSEGDDPTVTPPSEGDDPTVTPPTEEDDPPVTPEKNKIEDTELPHFDYSDGDPNLHNTDIFYRNSYEIGLGDPTVLYNEQDGYFYVSGTTSGKNFKMWRTKDFNTWEDLGIVYTPPEDFFGTSSFWAPQLFYDADAGWKYYLGEDAEEGEGLYILFFSARRPNNSCCPAVAFSKTPEGPYTNFVGTNKNGDYIDPSIPLFDIEKLNGLGLYADHIYGDLYKANRSFIDACPYVDPITNEKYLYFVRNRITDKTNDVWGVKMKDWVTPDYSTTTPLTSHGYTTIEKTEVYNFTPKEKIDEGPFLYYKDFTNDGIDNGKYYLTLSLGGTNSKFYPVIQAVGDSPLGPFTKIQPEDGGIIIHPGELWNVHGSGHHAFFDIGGELFVAYHSYKVTTGTSFGSRYFGFDKIEWVLNACGEYILRANGPTISIQPLPEAVSGYKNLSGLADITSSTNDDTSVLNDGLIALHDGDGVAEYSVYFDTVITLSFKNYVSARAVMIYNSYLYENSFENIDRIEFSYRRVINGKIYYGTAYINNLGFNYSTHLIPDDYLEASGVSGVTMLRPSGAAIAEFDPIEINEIRIFVSNKNANRATNISEIYVLGTELDDNLYAELSDADSEVISYTFPIYTDFISSNPNKNVELDSGVEIDASKDDAIWQSSKTEINIDGVKTDSTTKEPVDIETYGERGATLHTYIGKSAIYFIFEVKDKNLYFDSSSPQGRSSCVELYFTTENKTTLSQGCYSVRVNPTGLSGADAVRIGTYVPNDAGTEWKSVDLKNKVMAAVIVNGRVKNSASDYSYTTDGNEGYIIEIAIDKSLIGYDANSLRFTAAFVQDKELGSLRMGNSFIEGTHYTNVSSWIVITNDGIKKSEEEN